MALFFCYFSNLCKVQQKFEDTNLVLSWEKCHFIVKNVIVLGHKISKDSIKVYQANIELDPLRATKLS